MTNVLLYVTDDQRSDTLRFMPRLRGNFLPYAREFTRAYANTAVCMAARAGLFSGQYARRHGVYTNSAQSWNNGLFDPNNTVARWLHDAGYRTGFVGKWHSDKTFQDPKPRGFDHWRSIRLDHTVSKAFDFRVTDGSTHTTVAQYVGDWLTSEALTFVAGSEPWFLTVADVAPHLEFRPHPDDLQARSWHRHPVVDEAVVSDKPSWVRARPAHTKQQIAAIQRDVRRQLRHLLAADRAFDAICTALDFRDTLVLYVSDNGAMWGEHRYPALSKYNFYEPASKVPLLARGPGFRPGRTDVVSAAHQDVTRTIAAVAGVTPPIAQDGIDLRTLQDDPASFANRAVLLERTAADGPAGKAIVKATRKLMRYPSAAEADRYEMYDLDADPDELANVAYQPTRVAERNVLELQLLGLLA